MFTYQETSPWVNRISRLPFPLGTLVFLATSRIARQVFKRVIIDKSTDTALHPIYNYRSNDTSYNIWDHRWQSSKAAQSLRFRFEWIKAQLKANFLRRVQEGKTVEAISLGAGTGLAFIEILNSPELKDQSISAYFVDKDPKARARAMSLALGKNLRHKLEYITSLSSDALNNFGEGKFDIIELVGIAEYVTDAWLQEETARIFKSLKAGGVYLGVAISSAEEHAFAHKVLHWPRMEYRSKEELEFILRQAGFTDIKTENCGVFVGWVATRD